MAELDRTLTGIGNDYRRWLEQEYLERRSRNRLYSIRSFARQLGVSKTSLAEVLAGKRDLSKKNALLVAARLHLSPSEKTALLDAVSRTRGRPVAHPDHRLSDDTFRVISDLYHYAILNLAKLPSHEARPEWLAERLHVPVSDVTAALDRLVRLDFLEIRDNRLVRKVGSLDTVSDAPSGAVRRHHAQTLRLAEASLERDPVEAREFGVITCAVDASKVLLAKERIRAFRRKLAVELESKTPDRVYTLSIQFFPVAKGAAEEKQGNS
jgi:transcriptional regulator with XRE-family HTH domain